MFSNPGSYIGIIPKLRLLILSISLSTQQTSKPNSEKQVPDTKPTYPVPNIVTFIIQNLLFLSFYNTIY